MNKVPRPMPRTFPAVTKSGGQPSRPEMPLAGILAERTPQGRPPRLPSATPLTTPRQRALHGNGSVAMNRNWMVPYTLRNQPGSRPEVDG
jgi:hypothetical protein